MILLGAVTAVASDLAAHGQSRAALVGVAVLLAAVVAWGVATALGLLWMRTWALVSTLIFSFLLLATGLGVVVVAFLGSPAVPQAAAAATQATDGILGAVFLGVALWWIVYFVRPRTQAAFFANRRGGEIPRLPLSIAVIGWMLLGGGGLGIACVPLLGARSGFSLAGHMLHGQAAQVAMVLVAAVSMIVGLGLVELRRWARATALVWLILVLISFALTWLAPPAAMAGRPGMRALSMATVATTVSLGIAACLAQIYFLWTRKAAFMPLRPAPVPVADPQA